MNSVTDIKASLGLQQRVGSMTTFAQRAARSAGCYLVVLLLALPMPIQAQVPANIDYRGYLTNDDGEPITDIVSVSFRIYDAASAGTLLWEETQSAITVSAGRFDAVLGSVNALADDADIEGFDRTLYLGLAVNGAAEMVPRLPLPGSAFSFAAARTKGRTSVDCNAGQTIGQALANAPAGGRYIIDITGDCTESVTISRDRTTLRGIGGARLLGGFTSNASTMAIAGARRVEIDALIIEATGAQPGASGIVSYDNASFSLRNGAIVRNFPNNGIFMHELSSLLIQDSTVTGNGGDGVAVVSASHAGGVNATVTNNGSDGFDVHNNSTLALRDSTISGNSRRGVIVTLGSALSLDGNNTIESSAASSDDGVAIGLWDRSVLSVSGGGNRIINTVPAVYAADDPFSDGGGFALTVSRNSSARIDRGSATINGWVETYNLSTIDIRNATINGHLAVGGLDANIHFRNEGSSILNGNVRIAGGTFSANRTPSPTAVTINGNVDCRGGSFGPTVDFQDDDDGYINCTQMTTDLSLNVERSATTVTAGNPVSYTFTLDNLSSAPFVQGTQVSVFIGISALDYRVESLTPSQGSCSDLGSGDFTAPLNIVCDLGLVGPAQVTITMDVTSNVTDTLNVDANIGMSNPDSNPGDNVVTTTTTVTP